jgi:hypothetical protein
MFLLGCAPGFPVARAPTAPTGTVDTAEEPVVGGGEPDDDEDEQDDEDDDELPGACEDVYAEDLLPDFYIEISQDEWAKFAEDYATWQARRDRGEEVKPWHHLDAFTYDGETWQDVEIRLKGNPCCSWVGSKYQFVVSFNEIDPDQRFHGLRELAFDGPYYEASFLHERLAASWQADLGLPALCVNNARLFVNGEYYGLYANVEVPDKEFLQRNFGKDGATGNLYKFDYTAYEWEQKEGDGDWTDLEELYAIQSFSEFEAIADVDENILFWAADAILPNADGYWVGSINFIIYDHPERGWMMIPWDQDATFWSGTASYDPTWHSDYYGLTLPLDYLIWEDAERYYDAVRETIPLYDPTVLGGRVDAWSAQIADAAHDDPTRYFSSADHDAAIAALRLFPEQRRAFLDAWAE